MTKDRGSKGPESPGGAAMSRRRRMRSGATWDGARPQASSRQAPWARSSPVGFSTRR